MKVILVLFLGIIGAVLCQSPVGDVVGKLVVGYQAWFDAPGSGSPRNGWIHWGNPVPGQVTFELYPDVREYDVLYETNLGNLGNGEPSRLFSSYNEETIDTQVRWMEENNIDTAALQRFAGAVQVDPGYRDFLNHIAQNVQNSAERHGRKFYIMWDISGWDNFNPELLQDLDNNLKPLGLFNSSAYAYQNGKPVICIWGFGFTDRPDDPNGALEVINNLKGQGFYVIGGVPTHWRTNDQDSMANYQDVYFSLDMLQPWSVGRFSGVDGARNYADTLRDDYALLQQHGIDFQPVLFAGFSWSNFNPGPQNEIPRLHGDFLWQQFYNIRDLGITNAYVAMFDEYDEGTAIAKAAEDASMVPVDQYFLTLDADGVHVSSDFYLRLTGDGNRMMKGEIALTPNLPTPFTL